MIEATNLKNGTTFKYGGKPYRVVRYTFSKIGRGGATVRVSVKNLLTGSNEEKTFSSAVKVDEITTTKRKLQYLYSDGETAYFMDPTSYEQVEIPKSVVEDELLYIKEGEEVTVLFWSGAGDKDDRALSIDIPPKVTMVVTDTAPGTKGNSATNMYKTAKLENGLDLKVPLFINKGDKIRIDTRTGGYVERVK